MDYSKLWPAFIQKGSDSDSVDDKIQAVYNKLLEEIEASSRYTGFNPIYRWSFDGEKTPGEIGLIKDYFSDFDALRARSWQMYRESDVAQIVVERAVIWIIGSGLKLQSEPINLLLELNKVNVDTDAFSRSVEAKFRLWAKSTVSDYCGVDNLNRIANQAYIHSKLGGDVLVIQRPIKGRLTVELIDGANIQNPFYGDNNQMQADENRGYKTENGIVMDKNGAHVAYWVKEDDNTFTRVKAKTTGGMFKQAFMVYGKRHRKNENRGVPALSVVLETIKKVDRYKEATVGAAEELAKLVYFIVHKEFSSGESPNMQQVRSALKLKDDNPKLQQDSSQAAAKIASSVQKQVHNLPIGADIKTLDHKGELTFKEFFTTNVNVVCAAFGIPPEVAFMLYNSNFSASRAALKDWEHTIMVGRDDFSFSFYQPIYEYWLAFEAMKDRIDSVPYIRSVLSNDFEIKGAFENARFVGSNVPHIDPLKEVQAERAKLGDLGKNIPLTTAEAATEALGAGDYESNATQFEREVEGFEPNSPQTEPKSEPIEEES